jgi:hypothetical protein
MVSALVGIVQASPAMAAPGLRASSAVAAPGLRSVCPLVSVPSALVFGDPTATYWVLGGLRYNSIKGLAFKVTGQFPHSTTYSWTGYDDYGFIKSPAWVLNDAQIAPDPGSVNPFQPGNLVNAPNRNHTVWIYPEGVRVPPGLKNVVRFGVDRDDPTDKGIRWSLLMRFYQMQPGYTARGSLPTVQAVSAANPSKLMPCPVTRAGSFASYTISILRSIKVFGPASPPPEPPGNRILFTRVPYQFVPYPEGFSPDNAIQYATAGLDISKISVVTWHRTATFFNNQSLNPGSVMGDYQARYMSVVVTAFPTTAVNSVNQDDATFQPDGSWVTVVLPSKPLLSPAQTRAVRAKAAMLGYNVISSRTSPLAPLPVTINVRMKVPNSTFCCSILKIPSWTDPANPATADHNYRDFLKQDSPQFFATYYSHSSNMGPYWIDGVKETFAQFMGR